MLLARYTKSGQNFNQGCLNDYEAQTKFRGLNNIRRYETVHRYVKIIRSSVIIKHTVGEIYYQIG